VSKTQPLEVSPQQEPFDDLTAWTTTRLELARTRLVCRTWSETIAVERRADQAAAFTWRALQSFAAAVTPDIVLRGASGESLSRSDRAAAGLAASFGRTAARLSILEGLHFVTSLYPALLSTELRSRLGAFYTPPVLAIRLLDQATQEGIDWRTARVLDPAAGGGVFLLHAALRMRAALADCAPALVAAQIGTRLIGFEVDRRAADIAQAAIDILLSDLVSASGRSTPTIVRVCNTLEEAPQESFDLVVGNPPYGRVTLTSEQRQRYARSLYGHANLYGVFTDIALRWAKPCGLIAYLTPTSFLSGQYFSSLRGLLAKEAPPISLDFVHARSGVFEDVLQETLLAVYRKEASRRRVQVYYLNVAGEREADVTKNGTVGLPADPTRPWLAPREPRHSAIIRLVEKMKTRLNDWSYAVSTGPLVWNRHKDQLRSTPGGKATRPIIWAEAVTSDGRFVFRAEKKNHAPYFELRPKNDWLLVNTPCVLVQRTTAKEQARRLIAAELPSCFIDKHGGVVVENHLNMVRPVGRPKVRPAVLAAILNSRIVDEIFRCMNGSVAVSAFELEALPLPDRSALKELERLVDAGADKALIDTECDLLYCGAR
jgi:adenine-specific DNA-methyltransferase